MAEIIMPKMGDAMTEGKVVRWYKKAGDAVKKGEPVLEIETDKVNLDLEAEADGTLGAIAVNEGAMAPVGGVLAKILGEGEKDAEAGVAPKSSGAPPTSAAPSEQSSAPKSAGGVAGAPQEQKQEQKQDAKQEAKDSEPQQRRALDKKDSFRHSTGEYGETMEMKGPRTDRSSRQQTGNVVSMPQSGERRRSSPLARKMATEMGVSLEGVEGSGPRGRIVAADIKKQSGGQAISPVQGRAHGQAGLPVLQSKQIPLSAMRRTIAKRLSESTGPIPHFYLTADYDVTNLLSVRQQVMDIEGVKVSVNDFIIRATALALRHHPNVNASWGDEAITQHGEIHIGVAVATPEGLITPVIRNADQKSVVEIAQEIRALADKAKNRKLKPDEYQGSTFTISSLGAWGIEEFTAIINPPNVAILAIGAAEPRATVIDRQVVIRDRMKVTMSCDHRVVDGAIGAEYLKTLRQYLEQPLRIVI